MRSLSVCFCLFALLGTGKQFPTQEATNKANETVRRINPSRMPHLPQWLVFDLHQESCSIPQAELSPHNAIEGRFWDQAEKVWAVLCSRNLVSAIRIYRRAASAGAGEVGREPDISYLQPSSIIYDDGLHHGIGGAFRRRITTVSSEVLNQHFASVIGSSQLHDGIADEYIGRPAHVWYRSEDRWIKLGPIELQGQ